MSTDMSAPAAKPAARDGDSLAAIVALLVLPVAIYVAGWQIDWASATSPDSLLRYVLPVAFCVIVPSIIASTVGAVARAVKR